MQNDDISRFVASRKNLPHPQLPIPTWEISKIINTGALFFRVWSVQQKSKILSVKNFKNFALKWCCVWAVRAGFEPAVQFNPYGSLANY